jgi:putative Mg2+ transporter-C (MgtC) family protein
MPEDELRRLVARHGFSIYNLSYRVTADGAQFEYRMVLRAIGRESTRALSDALRADRQVLEYRIAPASD